MAIFTGFSKALGGIEKETPKQVYFYGLVEKNVLVTGADGQLGREMKALTGRLNLPFRFLYTDANELDITDRQQIVSYVNDYQIQYIVNCAAYTAVDKAEEDVEKAYVVNAAAVENIARVAGQYDVKVIHLSTDFVFDGKSSVPYTEKMTADPLSVYGQSKLKGEEALQEHAGDWIILRTSWLYSEFGSNFVKTMMRLMNEREQLSIVADQRGTPTYAADLAEMILHMLQHAEENEWKSGIYHFSNRGETTWFGFAQEIKKLAGLERCELIPIKTEEFNSVAARPAYSVMDLSKICHTFSVVIPSWEEALGKCIRRIKN
ncbi:MAG: dTDP-4-dehydrorhamnose reductase [Proteiniphilum sp.]|nr:dTDP-4-dehydrorhamnose reductase [Proteiniphilum sp.]